MRVKTFNTSGGEEETPEWLVKMVAQMGFQLQDVDGEPMQVETSTDQTQPYPLLSETDPLGMSEDYVPRTPPLESAPGQTQPYPLLSETDPLGMGEDYGLASREMSGLGQQLPPQESAYAGLLEPSYGRDSTGARTPLSLVEMNEDFAAYDITDPGRIPFLNDAERENLKAEGRQREAFRSLDDTLGFDAGRSVAERLVAEGAAPGAGAEKPKSSYFGANFVGPPAGLVPGTDAPFNPWNDLFTPWSDSFYGQQQVDAMNEGIDSFYSVAGARTSGGGYAGLEMYEAKIRNEGQEAADQWWDMRRKMFDLTRDQREEARQMGMELPDPLSQARLNWNMREVLGGDGGMISQSQLEGLSPEEAQIMFNERFPEYERRQRSLAYEWEQTLPYDYGLEGNMGNQVSALLGMEADGKLPRTNSNDPMSPYRVPRYQDFDQFDHINWANWMIKSNPDIYGFPKEHTPGDRDVSGLPDGSWETPLTPEDGKAYEDSSGAYIYDAETILREYFEDNVETSGMHLDRYGASQLKDMAEYVAMLLNQQQTGNNAGEAYVTTLNRVRQLRAQAGG